MQPDGISILLHPLPDTHIWHPPPCTRHLATGTQHWHQALATWFSLFTEWTRMVIRLGRNTQSPAPIYGATISILLRIQENGKSVEVTPKVKRTSSKSRLSLCSECRRLESDGVIPLFASSTSNNLIHGVLFLGTNPRKTQKRLKV